MKTFAFIILFPLLFGIKNNTPVDFDTYAMDWKKVEQFEKEGLPRSAWDLVKKIHDKALKAKNTPQIVKTFVYINRFTQQLEEDGLLKSIKDIQKYIQEHEGVEKQILQSILGEWYQNYAIQNLYKLRNQTRLDENNEDFNTWSLSKLLNKSASLYLASIASKNTKYTDIKDYESILHDINKTSIKYRPSLYEILMDRAITHFSNTQSYLTEPIYKFELNEEKYYDKWSSFDVSVLPTKDNTSNLYQATLLYHNYLNHFKKESNTIALAELELSYLKFVHNNSVLETKNDLFVKSLKRLSKSYRKLSFYSQICYELAQFYTQQAQKNEKSGNQNIFPKEKAYSICEDAILKYPNSNGAFQCQQLIQRLEQKSFNIQIEETAIPLNPTAFHIQYKNLNQLYFKIYQVNSDKLFKMYNHRNTKDQLIKQLNGKLVKTWRINLPKYKDYEHHTALDLIPHLGRGSYIIQVSNSSKFNKDAIIHQNLLIVSNMSYDITQLKNQAQVVVRNRNTGAPIPQANIEVFKSYYKREIRKNVVEFVQTGISDNNGFFSFHTEKSVSYIFRVNKGVDEYFHSNGQRFYKKNTFSPRHTTHIFTDRAIYRPGQKIYFKGLVLSLNDVKIPSIVQNEKLTIVLKNANYQVIKELELQTNEFGSIQGYFDIPKSVLTGNFRIEAKTSLGKGNKSIKVEAYKRPKFEVSINDLSKTYRLGDNIYIEGSARAFAGVYLENAKVRYSVKRTVNYPYFRHSWRMPYYYNNNEIQIANGFCSTNSNGSFDFKFEALADQSLLKRYKPLFNFEITIDVTDINGETHSATKSVSLASHSVHLNLDLPNETDISKDFNITTNTFNLDGVILPVNVSLKIEKLLEPVNIQEQKSWEHVDTILNNLNLDETELVKNQINPYENWGTEKIVLEKTYLNDKDYNISSSEFKIKAGVYKVSLSHKDISGALLETIKFISITHFAKAQFPNSKLLFTNTNQESYKPGDQMILNLGSGHDTTWVLYEIIKQNEIKTIDWIALGGTESIKLPIRENDRGGFQIRTTFLLHNKLYKEITYIKVPWSNKQLNIEYLTYRDHLEPGSKEEWRIRIKGNKGEQIASELLAGLYDASLDQFVVNKWDYAFFPTHSLNQYRSFDGFGKIHLYNANGNYFRNKSIKPNKFITKRPYFMYSIYSGYYGGMYNKRYKSKGAPREEMDMESVMLLEESATPPNTMEEMIETDEIQNPAKNDKTDNPQSFKIRKNFKETVFFYPQLQTDENGIVEIRFTMNEALTKWNFMSFAHSKDMQYVFDTKQIVTRKKIMVFPLAPRFFREGDKIQFSSKVTNLSDSLQDITVILELFDALSNETIQILEKGQVEKQFLSLEKGKSKNISWNLEIPHESYKAIGYRIIAKSDHYGDGEENTVPVVTNRMLMTETMPLPINGKETKSYIFKSLLDNLGSPTLKSHKYTIEYTSNPVWYAIQALPYIDNMNHECSEYAFSRFFVNALASHIANSNPKIQKVFEQWRHFDSGAFLSNLNKNENLKSALLEETPWILNALNEEQQKKNLALLFDLNKMSYEKNQSINKLVELQNYEGAFSWFPGGHSNRYMTQNIIEGIGHLIQLDVIDKTDDKINEIVDLGIPYLDRQLRIQYESLVENVKNNKGDLKKDHLGAIVIHYLYTRSFFLDIPISKKDQKAYDYYYNQALKYGLLKGVYLDGLVSLTLYRSGNRDRAKNIIASLKERAMYNNELGMYWQENASYYWHQLPIERQALLIEAFSEVGKEALHVNLLKTWLLKNKQTNNWRTSKATVAAIYALLINTQGTKSNNNINLEQLDDPIIKIGGDSLDLTHVNMEAGTGYFKLDLNISDLKESMANVEITNPNNNIAWGSIYWQYFEDLDKIKSFKDTPLKLSKKLYKEVIGDHGKELLNIDNVKELELGDKITVRILLEVDRMMEYVYLKDMRASGLEPINVFSSYKWQGNLGYYESTKDMATHFYIDYLPKGKYVFEYSLRVAHKGDFSNGITMIQSMYAPEFTSHSTGERIIIE